MTTVQGREHISNVMLVNRRRWSIAVEGFLLEDEGSRSSLELGDMMPDGTCRALTCRVPACVAARKRSAGKRDAPDVDSTAGEGASKNPRLKQTAKLPNGEQAGCAGGPGPKNAKKALPPLSRPANFIVLPTSAEEKQEEIFELEDKTMRMAAEISGLKVVMQAKEAELAKSVLECQKAADYLKKEATLQKETRVCFAAFSTTVKESVAKLSQAVEVLGPFASAGVLNAGGATSTSSQGRVRNQDSVRGKQKKGQEKLAMSEDSDHD